MLGRLHLDAKEYELAIAALDEAKALPRRPFARANGYRGLANLALKRYDEAIIDLVVAVESPDKLSGEQAVVFKRALKRARRRAARQ